MMKFHHISYRFNILFKTHLHRSLQTKELNIQEQTSIKMSSTDNVCEPCQYRKIHNPAKVYCNRCQESFCQPCADVHRASKTGRTHLLIDIQNRMEFSALGKSLEDSQLCTAHPNKALDFYCGDHKTFLCCMCLLTTRKHKKCVNVLDISLAGKALIKNSFVTKLQQYQQEVTEHVNLIIKPIKAAITTSKDEVESLSTQLDNVVEKLEALAISFKQRATKIKEDLTAVVDERRMDFEVSEREIETTATAIKSGQSLFRSVLETGSHSDVFRCAVSILGQDDKFKTEAAQIKAEVPRFKLVPDTHDIIQKLDECLSTAEYKMEIENKNNSVLNFESDIRTEFERSVGDCLLKNISLDVQLPTEARDIEGRVADKFEQEKPTGSDDYDGDMKTDIADTQKLDKQKKHGIDQRGYKVTLQTDHVFSINKHDILIGGIVGLPNGRIALSDCRKSRLLILNSDDELVYEIPLSDKPGSMTVLDDTYLVVCLLNTNKLRVSEITGTTKLNRFLKTRFHPKCVHAIDSEKMLVSMKDAEEYWYLHVMTAKGDVIKCIEIDRLYDGYKIAVQQLPGWYHIIQCCEYSNTVRGFENNGKQIFSNKFDQPSAVVTDKQGYIYVISFAGKGRVYSPDFAHFMMFPTPCSSVNRAAFNAACDKLYLTGYKSPIIVVMNVSRTKAVS